MIHADVMYIYNEGMMHCNDNMHFLFYTKGFNVFSNFLIEANFLWKLKKYIKNAQTSEKKGRKFAGVKLISVLYVRMKFNMHLTLII